MSTWRVIGLAAALFLSSTAAWAEHEHGHRPPGVAAKGLGAPEIDPSGLGSAAALVIGGTMLLAPRRARRRDDSR